mmetsp:Transcript_3215/g.12689  ORF Transcript_3215/g.12689 Transcript_3215/m.12689 type:complete len:287 (-) Transcript_3215:890-1750(-)
MARSTCTASPTAPRSSSARTPRPGGSASPCAARPGTAGTRRPPRRGDPAVSPRSGPPDRTTTASRGTSRAAASRKAGVRTTDPRRRPRTARGTPPRVPTTRRRRSARRICPEASTSPGRGSRWATDRSSPARARAGRTFSETRRVTRARFLSPWTRNPWRGTTRGAATWPRLRARACAREPAWAKGPPGRLPRTSSTTTDSRGFPRRRLPTSASSSTARTARTCPRFTASWARFRLTCTTPPRLRRWDRTSSRCTRFTRSRSLTSGWQTPTATRATSSCKSPRMAS